MTIDDKGGGEGGGQAKKIDDVIYGRPLKEIFLLRNLVRPKKSQKTDFSMLCSMGKIRKNEVSP